MIISSVSFAAHHGKRAYHSNIPNAFIKKRIIQSRRNPICGRSSSVPCPDEDSRKDSEPGLVPEVDEALRKVQDAIQQAESVVSRIETLPSARLPTVVRCKKKKKDNLCVYVCVVCLPGMLGFGLKMASISLLQWLTIAVVLI